MCFFFSDTVNMSSTSTISLTSHFNNIALHAIAISLSIADNALMQFVGQLTGSVNIGSGSRIETINHPLPRSLSTKTSSTLNTASTVGECEMRTDTGDCLEKEARSSPVCFWPRCRQWSTKTSEGNFTGARLVINFV
jgi:hypothetical protein